MVMYEPNTTTQSRTAFMPQPALTLSQLLTYNSLVRQREIATTSLPTRYRHSQDRETPLPIYLGIMIHTKTHQRAFVDTFFDLGLYISYHLVLAISTALGNKILSSLQGGKAVCPPQLKGGVFLLQWIISTTIPVLLVHMTRSTDQVLEYLPLSTSRRLYHWGLAECWY